MMDDLVPNEPIGQRRMTTDTMGGKQRAVAGVDTVMDLPPSSSLLWRVLLIGGDEQTGRKDATDPMKKAERDASAIIMPMLLTGGAGILKQQVYIR